MSKWDSIYQSEKDNFSSSLESLKNIMLFFKKNNVHSILDLGCGIGEHSLYLAKNGFDVVGFDISSEAIKLAKQKLDKEKNLSVKFLQGSMYNKLPSKDNYFDAVISLRTINHGTQEQIWYIISEIYRILKKDGYIFITVIKINGRKNILGETKLNNLPVKMIAPYTYIPLEGKEKGILHFMFNKKVLFAFFKKFKVIKFWINQGVRHWENYYCLLAQKI